MRIDRESATIRQKAADVLRQAIIDQRFAPGTHLVERELCDLLGVSRTSVREALRHLESERLIRMVPHRGPVVASLSAAEAREIYQVRAALEGLAGELFAEKAGAGQIARLAAIVEEVVEATQHPEAHDILDIKARFYAVLFAGADNDVCDQMLRSLNARVSILRRMSWVSPGRAAAMVVEVRAIAAAAVARDPVAMRQACVDHVMSACAVVLPVLAQAEAGKASDGRS